MSGGQRPLSEGKVKSSNSMIDGLFFGYRPAVYVLLRPRSHSLGSRLKSADGGLVSHLKGGKPPLAILGNLWFLIPKNSIDLHEARSCKEKVGYSLNCPSVHRKGQEDGVLCIKIMVFFLALLTLSLEAGCFRSTS